VNPIEAIGRAVCADLGTHPDTWQGFEGQIRKALDAFLGVLPDHLAEQVREHLEAA
jgi:hypothetical protein